MTRYERVCFEKDKINQTPVAAFICPGHPLMNATIDLILERHGQLLKQGAVLVDERDEEDMIRVLFYLEHAVQDGRQGRSKEQQVVSQRLQFVEYCQDGRLYDAGPAPYLDYRPATDEELVCLKPYLEASWLCEDIERKVIAHAVQAIVPGHIDEVRMRKLHYIDKVESEVTTRLKKEINYWDRRSEELKAQERAGKKTRLSSGNAMARADELAERLQRRLDELNKERQITALPPVIRGGAIVVPEGLLRKSGASTVPSETVSTIDRDKIEELVMAAVIEAERNLGRTPRNVSDQKGLGYDIESKALDTGSLFFIEVKGRWVENDAVTLTKNEILCSRNEPEKFRLALVSVDEQGVQKPRYIKGYVFGEPDFAETTRTFSLQKLLKFAGEPC
jgi:hypothetical protein